MLKLFFGNTTVDLRFPGFTCLVVVILSLSSKNPLFHLRLSFAFDWHTYWRDFCICLKYLKFPNIQERGCPWSFSVWLRLKDNQIFRNFKMKLYVLNESGILQFYWYQYQVIWTLEYLKSAIFWKDLEGQPNIQDFEFLL